MGFSSSTAPTHNDGDGQPVPSRAAGPGELERLAAVVADHPGTTVEMIVPGCLNGFSDEEMDLLTRISLLAARPVNWNVLAVTAGNPEGTRPPAGGLRPGGQAGGRVVALTLPHTMALRLSFDNGAILEGLPGWREFFARPVDERMAVSVRPGGPPGHGRPRPVRRGGHPPLPGRLGPSGDRRDVRRGQRRFEGRPVGSVAAGGNRPVGRPVRDRGGRPVAHRVRRAHPRVRRRLGGPGRDVAGPPSGGRAARTPGPTSTPCAVPSTPRPCSATACANGRLFGVEEAVRLLTDVPARLYGLVDRGRLSEGWWADLVVFDPATVGAGSVRTRSDLPGGAEPPLCRGRGRGARPRQRDVGGHRQAS